MFFVRSSALHPTNQPIVEGGEEWGEEDSNASSSSTTSAAIPEILRPKLKALYRMSQLASSSPDGEESRRRRRLGESLSFAFVRHPVSFEDKLRLMLLIMSSSFQFARLASTYQNKLIDSRAVQ